MKKVTGILLSSTLVLSNFAMSNISIYANSQTKEQQNEAESSKIQVGKSVNITKGKMLKFLE